MAGLAEGQQIQHELFGAGVVTQSDEERTTIDFEAHGTKKFVTGMMKVELIGDAPLKLGKTRRRRKTVKATKAAA